METYRIRYRRPTDPVWKLLCWFGSREYWTTASRSVADVYCAALNLANQGSNVQFEVYAMD